MTIEDILCGRQCATNILVPLSHLIFTKLLTGAVIIVPTFSDEKMEALTKQASCPRPDRS